MLSVMLAFGFDVYDFQLEDFLVDENNKEGFVSFGSAPFRIEILATTLGISFTEAYINKKEVSIDGVRPKYLLDIENLPDLD